MADILSPDGARYFRMAHRLGAPLPFHLRWLLPWLAGTSFARWRAASWGGWALWVACVGCLGGWPAALLVATLSGPALGFRLPVLVDGLAMGLAGAAALPGPWWAQVALGLLAGCVSERAPLFAALWGWSPWPLVGLLAPALRGLWPAGDDDPRLADTVAGEALRQPWRIGLARNWHDPNLLLPWGGLLAALLWLDGRIALTLGVAYAQLFVATDAIRLYQWAAPVLAVTVAQQLDWRLCVALAVITWFNPRRGDGV